MQCSKPCRGSGRRKRNSHESAKRPLHHRGGPCFFENLLVEIFLFYSILPIFHRQQGSIGMGIIEIAAIVAAIALVALACFAIPVLIALKNTMIELKQLTGQTESVLKIAVQDLHETLSQVRFLTIEASERLEEVKPFTQAVSETGRHIRSINTVLGAVTGVIAASSLWVT